MNTRLQNMHLGSQETVAPRTGAGLKMAAEEPRASDGRETSKPPRTMDPLVRFFSKAVLSVM